MNSVWDCGADSLFHNLTSQLYINGELAMLGVGGDRIGNIKDCVLVLDDIPPYGVINERSEHFQELVSFLLDSKFTVNCSTRFCNQVTFPVAGETR